MRLSPLAIGPVLAGCALVALTSCSTDEPQTEAGLAPTMSPAVAAVSAYDIVKVPSITIDGNLNDWANITSISMADNSGRPAGLDNTANVKLAWDDTYLYAAYDVTDTELLAEQTARDHQDIYLDDAVELYIDPQGDGSAATSMTTTDYQFLANIREALGDNRGNGTGGKDATYNAASFLAKAVTNGTLNVTGSDVGYIVELRISWSDLGVTPAAGNFMRLDLVVEDDDTQNTNTEEFDWAGLPTFNNPSGWKDVQLVNPMPVSAYDIVKVSGVTVDGNLSDWTGITAISMADNSGRTGGVDNTAKVRLAWDPTYLYYAYDVTDSELLAQQTVRDADSLYRDDEVELYIDPERNSWTRTKMTATDYQFLANVREAVGDNKGDGTGGKDASFNAASFLAEAVTNGTLNAPGTDVGYAIEARIAWSDLGITPAAGNFMRVDLAVGDRDGAGTTTEEFDWAGLSTFNNPSAWKDVKLVVDATAPAAPTNPALTVVSSSQINVSWTASTSADVAKYRIYRGTNGADPTLLTTDSGSPYQDTGLAAGTSYTYQLSAVDAAGNESAKTSPVSATTTPPPSAAPGGTIGVAPRDGPETDISGDSHRTTQFDGARDLPRGARIEAGTGAALTTWRNDGAGDRGQADYTITRLGDSADASFHGGRVIGDSPEDGTWSWDTPQAHDFHSQTCLYISGGKRWLVEHFACRNKGDGVGFTFGALDSKDGGVVRWSAIEDGGDNNISNDTKNTLTLFQNFFSGVSFYESRPNANAPEATYNASHKTVTFDGNLMWLKPKRFSDMKPWNSGALGAPVVFMMFKMQLNTEQVPDGASRNTKVALMNNVIRYDGINGEDQAERVFGNGKIWGSLDTSKVVSSSNNLVLFPNRSSGVPTGWPSGLSGFSYLYGNAAKARWNQEINAWVAAHPEVIVSDRGLF